MFAPQQTALLVAALLALPAGARAANPAGLRFQQAVYDDAAENPLRSPEGVACDDRGALVIADTGNGRLLTFTWKDGALGLGALVKLSQLTYPTRVQIDSKGFVLALDRRTRKIVRVDSSGAFGGFVEPRGAASTPVVPASFKLGPGDELYVLDVVARKVVVVAPDGKVTRELPLPAAAGVTDVAVDPGGKVYVVDGVTAVVFAAEPGAKGFTALSRSLKDVIAFPTYLTGDGRGKLYLVDQNGSAVVRLGIDGTFQGRELAGGWREGAVSYPGQLCLNGSGDVFLADRNNHRVQIFALPR